MITNYYKLFDLVQFEDFRLTTEDIFQKLSEAALSAGSIDNLASHFETGIYILSNDYVKTKYDYILKYG